VDVNVILMSLIAQLELDQEARQNLIKIMSNIIDRPTEDKCRKLRQSNPKISQLLTPWARELLTAVGFRREVEGGETYYRIANEESLQALQEAHRLLRQPSADITEQLRELQGPRQEEATTAAAPLSSKAAGKQPCAPSAGIAPAVAESMREEPRACPWGCKGRFLVSQLEAHKAACVQVCMRCPCCDERVRRCEAESHWARCPMLPVECGACDHLCLRRELAEHQAQCMVLHPPPPPPPPPPPSFQCQLCLSEEPVDGSFEAAKHDVYGAHHFCFECTSRHAANEISSLSEAAPPNVTCPARGCNVLLTFREVQNLSELQQVNDQGEPIHLALNSYDKYVRLVTLDACRRLPGFTACPAQCGWGIIAPAGGFGQFFHCEDVCKKWYCLRCLRDGVDGKDCGHDRAVSCEAHRLQINHAGAADALLLRAQSKPCPGCGQFAAKVPDERGGTVHGCMRITHRDCPGSGRGLFEGSTEDTLFCWCCLAPQRPIMEHGLSFHKPECLLWEAPIGSDTFKSNCFQCSRKGDGTFCDGRPTSDCTRRSNGAIDTYYSHFCACQHGCPCDSEMTVHNACTCPNALDGGSNDCSCGRNQVRCGACEKTLCRLCGRAPHAGFKCIEDRTEGDPSPPGEADALRAAARTPTQQAARRSSGAASSSDGSSAAAELEGALDALRALQERVDLAPLSAGPGSAEHGRNRRSLFGRCAAASSRHDAADSPEPWEIARRLFAGRTATVGDRVQVTKSGDRRAGEWGRVESIAPGRGVMLRFADGEVEGFRFESIGAPATLAFPGSGEGRPGARGGDADAADRQIAELMRMLGDDDE